MLDPVALEESFNQMLTHLNQKAPDGIIEINLQLLDSLNLMSISAFENQIYFASTTDQFYMVEAEEKLTLFNQEYVIWMLPAFLGKNASTYVFIAKNFKNKPPMLELIFQANGVYNTSSLVLTVLDAFLKEMKENENLISQINDY